MPPVTSSWKVIILGIFLFLNLLLKINGITVKITRIMIKIMIMAFVITWSIFGLIILSAVAELNKNKAALSTIVFFILILVCGPASWVLCLATAFVYILRSIK